METVNCTESAAIISTSAFQMPSAEQVAQSGAIVTESLETRNQAVNTEPENLHEPDSMDDGVQIVLSVPRRRKKKRRRLMSQSQPGGPSISSVVPKLEDQSTVTESSARRKSTSVVHRLESCRLGEKPTENRRGSLPAVPLSSPVPVQQDSWNFNRPLHSGSKLKFTPYQSPLTWWDGSSTSLPRSHCSNNGWLPWHLDDNTPKKRKFEDGWYNSQEAPLRKHYRASTQVSPRTNPIPMNSMSRLHSQQPALTPANTFDRQMPMNSADMMWPPFDWEPYRVPNPQNVSPYTQSSMDLDVSNAHQTSMSHLPSTFSEWPTGQSLFQQDFQLNRGNHSMLPPPIDRQRPPPTASSCAVLPGKSPVQPLANEISALQQQSPRGSLARSVTSEPSPGRAVHPMTSIVVAGIAEAHAASVQNRQSSKPPVMSLVNTEIPNASDVMRKPSLYRVPAWPVCSSPSIAQVPIARSSLDPGSSIVSSSPTQQIPSAIPSHNSPTAILPINTTPIAPSVAETPQPKTSNANTPPRFTSPASSPDLTPVTRDDSASPRAKSFQVSKARAGRKHSPNLIVDIAETCQELFPFSELAERHSVPMQKVFDTFSAIIQLPLLRNADDRRRHGSLGKRRMKDFRDAKKAMARAQEAERKAKMKAMGSKVDEASKASQVQAQASGTGNGNGNGLLKAAIMNNAGMSQGMTGV